MKFKLSFFSLFSFLLAFLSSNVLVEANRNSQSMLLIMQRLFQSRIDQLDDDTRLRQAEVAVQNILNNVLQRDCNKCFRRWPRLLNYCNKIPVKRRVAFLNRYHCR